MTTESHEELLRESGLDPHDNAGLKVALGRLADLPTTVEPASFASVLALRAQGPMPSRSPRTTTLIVGAVIGLGAGTGMAAAADLLPESAEKFWNEIFPDLGPFSDQGSSLPLRPAPSSTTPVQVSVGLPLAEQTPGPWRVQTPSAPSVTSAPSVPLVVRPNVGVTVPEVVPSELPIVVDTGTGEPVSVPEAPPTTGPPVVPPGQSETKPGQGTGRGNQPPGQSEPVADAPGRSGEAPGQNKPDKQDKPTKGGKGNGKPENSTDEVGPHASQDLGALG